MTTDQIVREEPVVVQAPALPTLARVAQALQARDRAAGELSVIRETTEAQIYDLTQDLRDQINAIREREEAKITKTVANLMEEKSLADEIYQREVQRCVEAGVMQDARYEIVNKTRINHPIVPKEFFKKWPEIFEKVVSIDKNKAEAAIMTDLGLKKATAQAQLAKVCVDVPTGPPQWELEVRKQKGGA